MAAWHTASSSREFGNLLTTGWIRSWCLGPRCRDASNELMRGFPTEWWSGPPDDINHNVIPAEKRNMGTRPHVWDEAQAFFFFLVVVFYFSSLFIFKDSNFKWGSHFIFMHKCTKQKFSMRSTPIIILKKTILLKWCKCVVHTQGFFFIFIFFWGKKNSFV